MSIHGSRPAIVVAGLALLLAAGCSSSGSAAKQGDIVSAAAAQATSQAASATPDQAASLTPDPYIVADPPAAPPPYPGPAVTAEEPTYQPGCSFLTKSQVAAIVGYPIVSVSQGDTPPGCDYKSSVNDFVWGFYGVAFPNDYHLFLRSQLATKSVKSWKELTGYPSGIVAVERTHVLDAIGWSILFYIEGKKTMGVCSASGYNGVVPAHEAVRRLCLRYAELLAPSIR